MYLIHEYSDPGTNRPVNVYTLFSGVFILRGIKRVLPGEWVFEPGSQGVRSGPSEDYFVKTFSLSRREPEVIKQIRLGLSSEQIAEAMCLSYETIKSHRKNIFFKLNISKASELIAFAIKTGSEARSTLQT